MNRYTWKLNGRLNIGSNYREKPGERMFEISKEAKMIIASNLTIAASIRDAAMAMKSGPQPDDSKDVVAQAFAVIYGNLQKEV